ncbi:MAG TPA: hypothetical protein VE129_16345 [Thermoanaerobaculia bacterium]|nr:hypothetical protein [Thermoanaerobaculia bacterium]
MDLSPAVILEDLLAAASPDFLASIREARSQYASGKTRSHEELFVRA